MNKPSSSLLEIEGLHIDYHSQEQVVEAVVNFNLKMSPGQKIGLVGESGSGKSTIAYAIMNYKGSHRNIRAGSIRFQGQDILQMSWKETQNFRGNRISMIYQEAMNSLNPVTTIGDQMMEVPIYKLPHLSQEEGKKLCLDTLAKVKIHDPRKIFQSYPFQLSGGQQQRVVIAMSLMTEPDILIMDEPTTSLDVTVEAEIMDLVENLVKESKTSLLLISHNLGLVLNTCDVICVLYSGQIVEQGSSYNIFHHPQHPYTGALFKCIPKLYKPGQPTKISLEPIPGQLPLPWERPQGCWFKDRCSYYQEGSCDQKVDLKTVEEVGLKSENGYSAHKVRCVRSEKIELFPSSTEQKMSAGMQVDPDSDEILTVKNLIKNYRINPGIFSLKSKKTFTATRDVSFQVKKGEILSIVGESGSGKSTIAKMIVGLEKTSDGEIHFQGEEIGKLTAKNRSFATVKEIQMIFQNPSDVFNPKIKIRSQIARTIYKLLKKKKRSEVKDIIDDLLNVIRMPPEYLNFRPHQLSGGQKQRVAIARAFAGNPSFVVADEPTSALDVSVQASIVEMLMEMQSRYQNTLMFISHNLALVSSLSDRVVVLYGGKIMEMGPTEAIFSPPYHPYSAVLISATPDLIIKKEKIEEGLNDQRILTQNNEVTVRGGCPYSNYCPQFIPGKCEREAPRLQKVKENHYMACHHEILNLEKISW